MATAADYVGKSFGTFRIEKNIAHGAEAEIFLCQHMTTGIVYILRLEIEDEWLWENEPMLPPENYRGELKSSENAKIAQLKSLQTYELGVEQYLRGSTRIRPTPIYGVLDNRYLVALEPPIKTKYSWYIDEFLEKAPADDLLYELWESLVMTMMGEAHIANESKQSELEWDAKWGKLTGGPILQSAMTRYLRRGNLPQKDQQAVLSRISMKSYEEPELAENLLVRMAGSLERRRMSANEVMGTLVNRFFRANITFHELQQFVQVYNILRSGFLAPEKPIKILEFMIGPLSQQPYKEIEKHDVYERDIRDFEYGQYKTILQEFIGEKPQLYQYLEVG